MSEAGTAPKSFRGSLIITALLGAGWLYLWFDWLSLYQVEVETLRILFPLILVPVAWWLWQAQSESPVVRYAIYSVCLLPLWHLLTFGFYEMGWMTLKAATARAGLCASFVVGLGWTTWWVERRSLLYQRIRLEASGAATIVGPLQAMHGSLAGAGGRRIWNPLDM